MGMAPAAAAVAAVGGAVPGKFIVGWRLILVEVIAGLDTAEWHLGGKSFGGKIFASCHRFPGAG